jgi:hypothetical protein
MTDPTGQEYSPTRVRRRVLAQARELVAELKRRGTDSLPEELQPFFQDGLTPSAIFEAGMELLKQRWSKNDHTA